MCSVLVLVCICVGVGVGVSVGVGGLLHVCVHPCWCLFIVVFVLCKFVLFLYCLFVCTRVFVCLFIVPHYLSVYEPSP